MRSRRTLQALVLVLLASGAEARRAAAQSVEVGLSGGRATDEHGVAHASVTLSPALTWAGPESVVRLSGRATAFQGGGFGMLGAEAGTLLARWGPLRLALGGEGSFAASTAGYEALHGALAPRARFAGAGWGLEAGPLLAAGADRGGVAGWEPLEMIPGEGGSDRGPLRWRSERGVGAAGWVRRGPLSVRAGWRGREVEEARWQEWSAAATADLGGVVLGLSAGRRTDGLREAWAGASVEARLSESLSLTLAAGSYPSDPLMGRAAGRYASAGIGLRLGGGRAADRPSPGVLPAAADGRARLSIRARPGARVELLGDWTGWRPMEVPETEPGEYAVEIDLPPGAHRFLFRVDGEWRTPDGFPTEPDGFGGVHAVLRVRGS